MKIYNNDISKIYVNVYTPKTGSNVIKTDSSFFAQGHLKILDDRVRYAFTFKRQDFHLSLFCRPILCKDRPTICTLETAMDLKSAAIGDSKELQAFSFWLSPKMI
jgi:hypothetical protein